MSYLKKKITISNRICLPAAILYIYIPIILFLCTWTIWYVATAGVLVSLIGIRALLRDYLEQDRLSNQESMEISLGMLLVLIAFLCVVGYYCGWGGWCIQAGDWSKHNAVLRDLTEQSWPVYYENAGEKSMLTYYIGHYLVPAMFGKLFSSFRVSEIVFFLWSTLGLFLLMLLLFRTVSADTWKKQLGCMGTFIGFNGLLLIGQFLNQIIYNEGRMFGHPQWFDLSALQLQFRNNYVALRWTTPSTLVVWIVTLLLWRYRKQIRHYAALLLPSLLFGALSFLGVALIALFTAVYLLITEKNGKEWLRNLLSPWNLLIALVLGGILFLYYAGNVFSVKPDYIGFEVAKYDGKILEYPLFCLCMFGCYSIFLWKTNKRNPVFLGANVLLLLLPLFRMGAWNDLLLNGGTAGMFVIMLAVLEYLCHHSIRTSGVSAVLACFLCIGCLSPAKEFVQDVYRQDIIGTPQQHDAFHSLLDSANRQSGNTVDLVYNYYTYDIESDVFYRYVARTKMKE